MLTQATQVSPTPSPSSSGSQFHPPVHRHGVAARRKAPKPSVRQRPSTKLAYERDVQRFVQNFGGTIPCGADDLISYIKVQCRRVAPATVLRRIMAIQDAHVQAGHPPPTTDNEVREAMRWLGAGQLPQNLLGKPGKSKVDTLTIAPRKKPVGAKPITRALLLRMFDAMGTGKRTSDLRDKMIFLLGYSGMKRGAITSIRVEDLKFTDDSMLVCVARSNENGDEVPKGKERVIAIPKTGGPLCAATACLRWLEHNDLVGKSGILVPRFSRSGEPIWDTALDSAYISVVLKRRLNDAGVEDVSVYSAESLCKGYEFDTIKGRRS
jgi:integrase